MDNIPTPDETRRDGVDAYPIILADNRLWGFARPTTRLTPVINRDVDPFGRAIEMIGVRTEISYPIAVRTLLSGLVSSRADGIIECGYAAFLGLAVGMLRLAHEIDEDTARAILSVQRDDIPRLVREILTVATGRNMASDRKISGLDDHPCPRTESRPPR